MKTGDLIRAIAADSEVHPMPPRRALALALIPGVAIALGQAGADVVVNFVDGDDAANAVVEEIKKAGSKAYAHKADVSSEEQVASIYAGGFSLPDAGPPPEDAGVDSTAPTPDASEGDSSSDATTSDANTDAETDSAVTDSAAGG